MASNVIENREKLLTLIQRKTELLKSIALHLDDISSNPIFIEEIHQAFMDLDDSETELLTEPQTTLNCPGCGFECSQIHNYCVVCGQKLQDDQFQGAG